MKCITMHWIEYGGDEFVAKMGAEAMQDVLSEMQLEKEAAMSP